jgi:hypothetical protein
MVKRSLLGIAMILGGLIAFIALLFMAIQVDPASSQEEQEEPTAQVEQDEQVEQAEAAEQADQVEGSENNAVEVVGDEAETGSTEPIQPSEVLMTEYRWPQDVLHDNGPLVNCSGCGVGAADESIVQNLSLGMITLGFGHQVAGLNWVADDFEVTDADGWLLDKITFFAYQTESAITSTITDTNWMIFDADPISGTLLASGGGLDGTSWTNIYRVAETSTGTSANRPIMANEVDMGGMYLPAGTYWIAWQTDGLLSSGPWAPPITVSGTLTTGNGLQSTDSGVTWGVAVDTGTFTQQGFPFIIEGTIGYHDSYIPYLKKAP